MQTLPVDAKSSSYDVQEEQNSAILTPLETKVSEILSKMEGFPFEQDSKNRIFAVDTNLKGNKRLVSRQPAETKAWRKEIKDLYRDYLQMKFAEKTHENIVPRPSEYQEWMRFKIKKDGNASWYELSDEFASKFSILSHEKEGKKTSVSLKNDEKLIFQKGILTRIFHGSHLECISFRTADKKADSFWAGWKTFLAAAHAFIDPLPKWLQNVIYTVGEALLPASPPWAAYQRVVHPSICEAALEILNHHESQCPKVVEICAGHGDLAAKIVQKGETPVEYYLLELNDRALQCARDRFKEQKNVISIKTDITQQDDYFIDATKQQPMPSNFADLVIGSGALTTNILENKAKAILAAAKCHDLLKPGGKMVLAGHGHSLLTNNDFETLGFKVFNSVLIQANKDPLTLDPRHHSFWMRDYNDQFYILEKKQPAADNPL